MCINKRKGQWLLTGRLLVICLCISLRGMAAPYRFSHYDVNDGLSQNSVLSIMQDHMGFMWIGTRNGLNRYDGTDYKIYRRGMTPGLFNNHINALYEDPHGEIWIGTEHGTFIYSPVNDAIRPFTLKTPEGKQINGNVNIIIGDATHICIASIGQGLFIYDIKGKRLTLNPLKGMNSIFSLALDKENRLWAGFYKDGLFVSTNRARTFRPVKDRHGAVVMQGRTITGIKYAKGRIYMSSQENGLTMYNSKQGTVRSLFSNYQGRSLYAHSLTMHGNAIYVATETGLAVYHTGTDEKQFYQYEITNPYSLSDDHLQTVYFDRNGGLWVGTYFGGVNYSPNISTFNNFFPRVDVVTSLFGRRVHQMDEDAHGRIWIGTEDNGLGYYSPHDNSFHRVALPGMSSNVQSLRVVNNQLWAGTFQEGISIIDLSTEHVVQHLKATNDHKGLNDANVFTIYPLHNGLVAIGTFGGLNIYNPKTKTMSSMDAIPKSIVYSVLEDHNYRLWVAVYDKGIYMLPKGGKKWRFFEGQKHGTAYTICLYEDSRGCIWAATDGYGVSRYNPTTKSFSPILWPQSKTYNNVVSIVEDRRGDLWMGTNEGLLCYNPESQSVKTFNTSNGLMDNTFSANSALCSHDGTLYMGCQSGLTTFIPHVSMSTTHYSPIVATELFVNGQLADSVPNSPLRKSISTAKSLTLKYNQNSFAIRVAVLSYRSQYGRQLQYMLEGFDDNWQQLYSDNIIRYTNLPAGHYRLIVKDRSTGGGSTYTLALTVKGPWWLSWWAIICYFVLSGLIIAFIFSYLTQRSKMNRDIAIRKLKYETEKELYRSKINFFTSVAHEIRTPVTLIKGPLTDIINRHVKDKEINDNLNIMSKNVNRLLNLVNQLLYFRKTETNGLKLNMEHCNINELTHDIIVRFSPLIKQKNITCNVSLSGSPIWAYVDKECITKTISNLMFNAVKYCEQLIDIKLISAEDGRAFQVVISNDGNLIAEDQREKIFKPFFRIESDAAYPQSGTGIGLAIARSMAELHHGTLHMEARDGLNVFILYIPVGSKPAIEIGQGESDETPENAKGISQPDETDGKYTVLLVDDNSDMLSYEVRHIGETYKVVTAKNGEEAIHILMAKDVDIIVTDVMMAPVDGFELCRRIKADINTSHIPVILLSALTMDAAKVKGIENGADYYIEKPFSMDYLTSVIRRLLTTRREEKRAFVSSPSAKLTAMSLSTADKKFVKKLEEVVDENLMDESFGITELADKMFMSRTNLNRKIKGVFDLTPNNYIKMRRLKKAARLMQENDYKVNEVCFLVGFNSPSYFTQCFQKQFGMLPKDFISRK